MADEDLIAKATSGMPAGTWTVEEAATAMLNLSVEGATAFADVAYLAIADVVRDVACFDQLPESAQINVAGIIAQVRKDMLSVGDRIADFAQWTPAQRDELNRRRNAVYEARLNHLAASSPFGGRA